MEGSYRARLRRKGQVTLPNQVREMLDLEEGDDLVFFVDEDGRVILDRGKLIPPEQAWFWTERWQQMEREAQADIDAGRVRRFENIDKALDDLEAIDDARDPDPGSIS
jgi:AbrB family looped-hinge helix DNA binding protein